MKLNLLNFLSGVTKVFEKLETWKTDLIIYYFEYIQQACYQYHLLNDCLIAYNQMVEKIVDEKDKSGFYLFLLSS